jgi:hypothetical protein
MKIRNCNARSAATVALVTLYFLLNTTIAKADTIYDISVKATFAEGTTNQVIQSYAELLSDWRFHIGRHDNSGLHIYVFGINHVL